MNQSGPSRHTQARQLVQGAPLALASLLLLIFAAALISKWQLSVPACGLRKMTGIPCPLCGSTRAFVAWSRFDLASAFWSNPLLFAGCLGICLWFVLWTIDHFFGQSIVERVIQRAKVLPLVLILLGAAFLNWLYLCLYLPQ